MFWKDGLSKKSAPERDIFCNIWKDGTSFFQKIWYIFFRRKMKQDDLYQKTRGNVIFFVCMRRHYRRGITPLAKKQKCPEKIHLRATSPASPKKVIFILDSSYFCWNTTFIYTLERAQEAATGDVLQEKACLEISQNSQGRTCARASFLIKLRLKTCNFIRPAVLLKKKLWHRCFLVNFAKFLRTLFLQKTRRRLFLEFYLFSVLLSKSL